MTLPTPQEFEQWHKDVIAEPEKVEFTDSEKLEFLFQVALKADKLMKEIGPQLIPMLEGIQKNPMLKMFLK